MTEHPITPPPELVQQWIDDYKCHPTSVFARGIATQAAHWGADQELEECREWLREAKNHNFGYEYGAELACRLRATRRPMPPSLKEQALEALNRQERGRDRGSLRPQSMADADIIRRALEALPND
jgi:hypothetical protein